MSNQNETNLRKELRKKAIKKIGNYLIKVN